MHVKDVNKGVRTFFLSAASRFNQANVSNEAIVISYDDFYRKSLAAFAS